jgi:hypothetical protein
MRTGSLVSLPGAEMQNYKISYTPATPSNYPEGVPDNVISALDTLATRGSSVLSTTITDLIAHEEFGGM